MKVLAAGLSNVTQCYIIIFTDARFLCEKYMVCSMRRTTQISFDRQDCKVLHLSTIEKLKVFHYRPLADLSIQENLDWVDWGAHQWLLVSRAANQSQWLLLDTLMSLIGSQIRSHWFPWFWPSDLVNANWLVIDYAHAWTRPKRSLIGWLNNLHCIVRLFK